MTTTETITRLCAALDEGDYSALGPLADALEGAAHLPFGYGLLPLAEVMEEAGKVAGHSALAASVRAVAILRPPACNSWGRWQWTQRSKRPSTEGGVSRRQMAALQRWGNSFRCLSSAYLCLAAVIRTEATR